MRSGYAASYHRKNHEEAEKVWSEFSHPKSGTPGERYMATSLMRNLAVVRYRGYMRVP
jgi:hypothetical protein